MGTHGASPVTISHERRPSDDKCLAAAGLLAVGVTLGALFRFLGRQPDLNAHIPEYIGLALLAGALYVVAVYLVMRFPLGLVSLLVILSGAVIFRLAVLEMPPPLSEDVYRYQWEGRVQRLGLNPYTVFPAMHEVHPLQDREHPLATGQFTPTLYPPLSEIIFSWVETIPAYKRLFTGLDLASLGVLLLMLAAVRRPLHRVVAYAWNPTVIVSFAMCGHQDSLAVFTLLVALLFIILKRPLVSMAFLACSTLAKLFSVLVLPALLTLTAKRLRWLYACLFGALVFLAYFPYLGAGMKLFKGASDYATGWEGNDSFFRLVRHASESKAQAELVVAVMVVGLVAFALKNRMELLWACLFLTTGAVLLSPNAFPWYFTWSIPFLCFYPNPAWLLMSVTATLGYAPVVAYAAGQPYRDSPLILGLEYGPVYVLLAYQGWRSLSLRSRSDNQPSGRSPSVL